MRTLKMILMLTFLALAGGSLAACDTLQDGWETVRDTVD
jgi:hypothetical protein